MDIENSFMWRSRCYPCDSRGRLTVSSEQILSLIGFWGTACSCWAHLPVLALIDLSHRSQTLDTCSRPYMKKCIVGRGHCVQFASEEYMLSLHVVFTQNDTFPDGGISTEQAPFAAKLPWLGCSFMAPLDDDCRCRGRTGLSG